MHAPPLFRAVKPRSILVFKALALAAAGAGAALAGEHGIAMYGAPELPPDFESLPHANADAPQGGRIVFGESGGFDSLNPFILAGTAPWAQSSLTVESLMGRSYDEPFTLYGLLAESVKTNDARDFVEFTLREEARFSDGSPVTIEDVKWSFETLGTDGHPRYHGAWANIETMERTGPRSVRFTFHEQDRELPLILGLRPILQKAQFEARDFARSGLDPVIGSGPYVVGDFEPGRHVVFEKNPDWWGADLPFNRGQHNLDEIRYEYFADGNVIFEAFTAGNLDTYRESSPVRWQRRYDFPALREGEVVKSEIEHERPSGITGFVFNTRRDRFSDWRVREALILAFNFEFINKIVNDGAEPRITSYFSNSELGMRDGPAEGRVRELLDPFADALKPGALDGYTLPASDGSEGNRANMRRAMALLEAAGWRVEDGVLRDADGRAFRFEILLSQGARDTQAVANAYVEALRRLGIEARVNVIDSAQLRERTNNFDFDMTRYTRSLSLSPGNEQRQYWGSEAADQPGSRNWMGVESPAIDAMIDRMLTTDSHEEFVAATRALDRALSTGRYVIPFWYSDVSRIAHRSRLQYPDRLPIYGDWIGFQPELWWSEE